MGVIVLGCYDVAFTMSLASVLFLCGLCLAGVGVCRGLFICVSRSVHPVGSLQFLHGSLAFLLPSSLCWVSCSVFIALSFWSFR